MKPFERHLPIFLVVILAMGVTGFLSTCGGQHRAEAGLNEATVVGGGSGDVSGGDHSRLKNLNIPGAHPQYVNRSSFNGQNSRQVGRDSGQDTAINGKHGAAPFSQYSGNVLTWQKRVASGTSKTVVYMNYSTGSDNNDGSSWAAALKTPQAVFNKVEAVRFGTFSSYWRGGYTPVSGNLSFTNRLLKDVGVYIQGMTTTKVSGAITTVRNNWPSGVSVITDGTQSWTTNQHQYRFLKITSGSANGQVRPISLSNNTAITIYGKWTTAPAKNDTYQIYSKNCVITGGTASFTNVNPVTFTDIEFNGTGQYSTYGSTVKMYYCYMHNTTTHAIRPQNFSIFYFENSLIRAAGNIGMFPAGKSIVLMDDSAIVSSVSSSVKAQTASDLWASRCEFSGGTNKGVVVDDSYLNFNTCLFSSQNTGYPDLQLTGNSSAQIAGSVLNGTAYYGVQATTGGQCVFASPTNTITKSGAASYGCVADVHGGISGTANVTFTMTNGATSKGVNVPTANSYGFSD